jgi:hypothetical protein
MASGVAECGARSEVKVARMATYGGYVGRRGPNSLDFCLVNDGGQMRGMERGESGANGYVRRLRRAQGAKFIRFLFSESRWPNAGHGATTRFRWWPNARHGATRRGQMRGRRPRLALEFIKL